jgi:hypothetical protein
LPKTGNCLKYLCKKNPHLSQTKLKEGVFFGLDTRNLMFDEDFLLMMTEVEREPWIAFKSVVTKFLEKNKDPDYIPIVANMLEIFKVLGCLMSLKIHFLNLNLDCFPENLGAVSEEQGERFHQYIKKMERIYQGWWNVNMMGDYCWTLHCEIPDTSHNRKSNICSFAGKRKRQ